MKLNEFLSGIVSPLFEKKEDADLFTSASAFKEVDIPDDVAAKFNQKYLTRERALSDEDLLKKFNIDARGRVFDSVDLKLKKLLPKLTTEDQNAINTEPNTLLKLELFDKAIDNLAKNEDIKKINEKARQREEELHEKIKNLEDTVKQKDTNFASKTKEIQLDYALKNKLMAFELAPEFGTEKHKNFLAESTISSLKKNFVLEFDDKDQSIIHLRKNADGQIVDVFEGNTKISLEDHLKKEYDPYIKKSTAGDTTTTTKPTKVQAAGPVDRPVTLNDKIRQAAAVG